MHNIMKIGIDILGVDEPGRIINFVNSYKDEEVELYVYGLEENLNKITKTENIIKNVCTEEVLMSDDAARVHRKKKDASMIRMLSDLNNDVIDVAISGGSTGADKTLLIDLDGAAKSIEAAQANGNIKHFVMVSALKAEDRSAWPDSMKPYYVAKHHADRLLEQSGLTYTIVRPGALTDDAGTGKVNTKFEGSGEIPREDVASFLVHVLHNHSNVQNKAIDLIKGDTPIEETL